MYTHQVFCTKPNSDEEQLCFQINNNEMIYDLSSVVDKWKSKGYQTRLNTIYTEDSVFVESELKEGDTMQVKTDAKQKQQRVSSKKQVQKIEINGKQMTIKQIAAEFGIHEATVRARVMAGKQGDDLIVQKAARKQPKIYNHNGKQYTINELAEMVHISVAGMRARLNKHENNIAAVLADQDETRGKKGKQYTVNGEDLTISEIANKYGINPATIRARIMRGWDGDKLVEGKTAKG